MAEARATAKRDRHADPELLVFKDFAKACPLDIELGSIEKRPPPEPDILCRCLDGSLIAFEMVGLEDPGASQRLDDALAIEKRLDLEYESVCDSLDSLACRFMEARSFLIFFSERVSKRKKIRSVPDLIRFLTNLDEGTQGFVPPSAQLSDVVTKIRVREHGRPARRAVFPVSSSVCERDYTVERITEKLGQRYQSDAPIELLAWVNGALPEFLWHKQLEQLLGERLQGSVFRRVWVFERSGRKIMFVYPEQEEA